jgi:hypothetical protein
VDVAIYFDNQGGFVAIKVATTRPPPNTTIQTLHDFVCTPLSYLGEVPKAEGVARSSFSLVTRWLVTMFLIGIAGFYRKQ